MKIKCFWGTIYTFCKQTMPDSKWKQWSNEFYWMSLRNDFFFWQQTKKEKERRRQFWHHNKYPFFSSMQTVIVVSAYAMHVASLPACFCSGSNFRYMGTRFARIFTLRNVQEYLCVMRKHIVNVLTNSYLDKSMVQLWLNDMYGRATDAFYLIASLFGLFCVMCMVVVVVVRFSFSLG